MTAEWARKILHAAGHEIVREYRRPAQGPYPQWIAWLLNGASVIAYEGAYTIHGTGPVVEHLKAVFFQVLGTEGDGVEQALRLRRGVADSPQVPQTSESR